MGNTKVMEKEKKEGFWQSYKYLIFGLVGALLLIASMSVQNVYLYYETEDEVKYAVKLDYSAFGMCIRCNGTTDNSKAIVEKAVFTGVGKEESVQKAVKGLLELAENKKGKFYLGVGGFVGNHDKTMNQLIDLLKAEGYSVEKIEKNFGNVV